MVRRSSSDVASSRVRASTLSNRRTFSIAIAGLVGECREKFDLFVGERPRLQASQCQHANRDSLAQKRHTEYGPKAGDLLRFPVVYSGSV